MNETKSAVQKRILTSLGLHFDEPGSGVSGNIHDGKTARRAFQSPEQFAVAIGVNKQLIPHLHAVLQVSSSCLPFLPDALAARCSETAELYARCPMPTTFHRLPLHLADVLSWPVIRSRPVISVRSASSRRSQADTVPG